MSGTKQDTLFAPITGTGLAAVTVYRLSGPHVRSCLEQMTGTVPLPGRARLCDIRDPESGGLIDRGLVLFFAAPKSFTGEDVTELHCHGGRAVRERLTEVLSAMGGLRPAEPGEFTRRAFENGRMDLMEAEGIHDLVCAETEAQRKLAFSQMRGELTRHYDDWREHLIRAMALFEAEIDFSDEEIPEGLIADVENSIRALKADMDAALDDDRRGQAIRRGFRIVVLGQPNVGKSSLFNRIAREDAAIVSDTPGTTRDALDLHLNLGGYAVVLTDTAGLRDSADAIEQEGVRRARARAADAGLRLYLDDARNFPDTMHADFTPDSGDFLVWNKTDLLEKADRQSPDILKDRQVMISALTGENIPRLLRALEATVQDRLGAAEDPVITRARHRTALMEAAEALGRFLAGGGDPSLRAEDLRLAARALGRVTGRVDVEDLLDVIFRDFCIGK